MLVDTIRFATSWTTRKRLSRLRIAHGCTRAKRQQVNKKCKHSATAFFEQVLGVLYTKA